MDRNCFIEGGFIVRGIPDVLAHRDVAMCLTVARFERGWLDRVRNVFMCNGSEVCMKVSITSCSTVLPGEVCGVWVRPIEGGTQSFRIWSVAFLDFSGCEFGPDTSGSFPGNWLGEIHLLAAYE